MADVRRLRGVVKRPGLGATLDYRGIAPRSPQAQALAKAIGRLRAAEALPLKDDTPIEFWGAERCWAHRFAASLWLYYKVDQPGGDEVVVLIAVHNYVHEQ